MIEVIVKRDRLAMYENRHPWLFSGAISKVLGSPEPGETVRVKDTQGNFLAWGLYNPHSQIRVRQYAFEEEIELNNDFWANKIRQAIHYREQVLKLKFSEDNACRLVNSEGDGLSGLTVDRYGGYLAVQFTSLALYKKQDIIINTLLEEVKPEAIVLRTEQDILKEEGLQLRDEVIYGWLPNELIIIREHDLKYHVNLQKGQKTGFYLDQRENRLLARSFAKDRTILDMCCYTGAFTFNALKGGAKSVESVDVSQTALDLAHDNASLNNLKHCELFKNDMFEFMEGSLNEGYSYDQIILDPPKLTRSKGTVMKATYGYLNLNRLALKLLKPKGILITCSCSGRIQPELFMLMLKRTAILTNRQVRIIAVTGAAPDHPVSLNCPESAYLKCITAYVE